MFRKLPDDPYRSLELCVLEMSSAGTTFICADFLEILMASTTWSPKGLCRPVMG